LRRAPPTGFWVVLPPLSRASALASVDRHYATIHRRLSRARANPAMGLCDLLSGVLDAVSAARLCERALAIECDARPQFAAALPFVGCHPLMGFMATEAMDVRSKPLPC